MTSNHPLTLEKSLKIVITGAGGFVGKELISQCVSRGIDATGVDVVSNNQPNFYQMDIRLKEVRNCIPDGADAIIHLAGLSRDVDCKNKGYDCFSKGAC